MKLYFLGAARTVTGSFFVCETEKARFAVDCGMFQGTKEVRERNYQPFRIDPASLEFLILTHAHIDHCGLIPKLCKQGFKGPIFCTAATADLVAILLPDSAHIQEMEVARKNRKLTRAGKPLLEPIYTIDDAMDSLKQVKVLNYDETFSPASGVSFRFRDAGHILGSAIVEMWIEENGEPIKLVFSGDLGNYNQRIIKDPTFIESADFLILESTYGDRLHESNTVRIEQLLEVIEFTMKKGGNLVIPSFAVERTQDLIYDLSLLYHEGRLPDGITVYVDSPLAIAATEIFKHEKECYDGETLELLRNNKNPFDLPIIKFTLTQEESMELNKIQGNSIIISASGMCEAGRIKHHLKHNLWRPESTILFVGFQAEGTLGRKLLDGEKVVTIHGESVAVKADIRSLDSYSAHADQAGIIQWLNGFKELPAEVILVHGEEKAQQTLAALIRDKYNIPVNIPNWLDVMEFKKSERAYRQAPGLSIKNKLSSIALQAEESYLKFRLAANRFFDSKWERGEYQTIIEMFENIRRQLEQN